MEQELNATAEETDEGKQPTFILDTGANPSYVATAPEPETEKYREHRLGNRQGHSGPKGGGSYESGPRQDSDH